jgi:hypothetical protein
VHEKDTDRRSHVRRGKLRRIADRVPRLTPLARSIIIINPGVLPQSEHFGLLAAG